MILFYYIKMLTRIFAFIFTYILYSCSYIFLFYTHRFRCFFFDLILVCLCGVFICFGGDQWDFFIRFLFFLFQLIYNVLSISAVHKVTHSYIILYGFLLMFKSLGHFEFMFVHGVMMCSSFINLHAAVQCSQHHLLKRSSFCHFIFLPLCQRLIDHRYLGKFLGCLFCSFGLYVCLGTSATVL